MGLVVAIVGAAVFLPALAGGWIYDDRPLIADNPYIRSFGWWWRWLATDFWDVNEEVVRFGGRMLYWRPLVTATYAADWQIGGGAPVMFHVTNTLLHAVSAGLAFAALRRWTGSMAAAAVAAIVFAVHPTKAESVAWIAGRTDVLCMIFVLLASAGISRRLRGARCGLALEVLGTIGAYTCKEQAIVLPAFAAVEAWVFAGRPALDRAALARIVRVMLPQIAVAVVYLAIRTLVLPISAAQIQKPLGFVDHGTAILETMGRFATLTFAPHDLSIQHALVYSQKGQYLFAYGYVAIGAVATAAMIAVAVLARRAWPAATVGIGFYLVTIAPTSNIKYTEMATLVSERFLYLPMLGVALVLGMALATLPRPWVRSGFAIAAAIAIALAAIAVNRSADFADEREFWARELRLHPHSREALNFQIRESTRAKRFASALRQLHGLRRALGDYDQIGAWDLSIAHQAVTVLRHLVPDREVTTLRAMAVFLQDLVEPREPITKLDARGVHLTIPTSLKTHKSKMRIYRSQLDIIRADITSRLGDDAAALEAADRARSVCAKCLSVVVLGSVVYARAGKYDEAIESLERVRGVVADDPVEGTLEMITKARAARAQAAAARGPAQLLARATELSLLEAWGRAYDVLAPYKDEIIRAPGAALGFAELAYRAGDPEVAREVVAANLPAEEVEPTLEGWGRTMGWIE